MRRSYRIGSRSSLLGVIMFSLSGSAMLAQKSAPAPPTGEARIDSDDDRI